MLGMCIIPPWFSPSSQQSSKRLFLRVWDSFVHLDTFPFSSMSSSKYEGNASDLSIIPLQSGLNLTLFSSWNWNSQPQHEKKSWFSWKCAGGWDIYPFGTMPALGPLNLGGFQEQLSEMRFRWAYFWLPHYISTPHLPVPYIFGTKLPVANISGNWATGSKYIGNWKMRVHTRFTQDQSVDQCETCFLRW